MLRNEMNHASIDLTNKSSPHPVILDKGVDGNWKSLSGHHAQVREGQVHDEHVGLSKKKICFSSLLKVHK